MNKTTIWQRMGALLMALVLVLGMLPVSARAAETGWAIGDASRLSVQLTRRGTAGNYHYEVSFVTGNVAQNNAAYYWCDSLENASGTKDEEIYDYYKEISGGSGTEEDPYTYSLITTHSTHTSANEDVGLKVVVDGLWVKVRIPEGAVAVDLDGDPNNGSEDMGWRYTATWATETALPKTVQLGVPFEVKWVYKCAEEQTTATDGKLMSCGVEAAAVTFDDSWSDNVQKLDDGRYVVTEKSAVTLTRVVSAGMGNTKRGTETRTASVVDTVFEDIQFNGAAAEAGKTTYVDSEDITLSVKCGVEDAAYMPELAEGITWEKGGNGIWTAKVSAGTYTIGGKTYTVAADTVALKFKDTPKAYVDGGKTYVEFALVEEPASGIQSVLLDTSAAVQQTDGRWEIGQELTGQAKLTVTSNVASQTSQTVDVIAPLAVTVIPAEEPDETGYIGVDELKVEASRDGTLKIGEDEIAVNAPSQIIEGNVGKYSKKNWTYTDDLGRVVTGELGAYIVDTEAPVITISETELSGYRAEDTTITVSVDDAGSGVDSAEVKYTLNDDAGEQNAVLNENNEATIVLANEQELKKISVYAVDKMGNKAEEALTGSLIIDTKDPEISLSISAETDGKDNAVTGTYNSKDGKTWLILESPVTSEAAAVTTFSIHATAADNLGMTNMAGWTNENGAWTKITEVAQVANHIAETEVKLSVPVVKDNAGNYPESLELPIGENQILTLAMNGDGTAYEAVVYIDRRYPGDGDGIPTVTFTTTAEPKETFEDTGVKLYNEASMTFSVEVTDNGSGFASGTLVLDKDGELKFLNGNSTNYGDGKYSITLVSAEQNENNELQLKLVVEDNVRNAYAYYHMFAFDNQAPRMTFAFDREYNHVEGGAYYFNADVNATVTVDELNFVSDSTKVEQSGGTLVQNGQVYTVKFDTEGEKTLTASSKDLAGNDSGKLTHEIGETFVVDTKNPTIQVIQTTDDQAVASNGDTHYYNETVTYSFTIADKHLTEGAGSAQIQYTINGTQTTLALKDLTPNEDNTVYTHSFTLQDGQTLTALSIDAVDNALNGFELNSGSNVAFNEKGVFLGGTIVVDTTAPVVTITKNAEPVNTSVENFDLYDGEVTYTISVEDANLDADSNGASYVYEYTYTVTDEAVPESKVTINEGYQKSFTITEAQCMTGVKLVVTDAAGNEAVLPNDGIQNWAVNAENSAVIEYTGNDVVVDTTAPKAELSFKCLTKGVELDEYYTNGNVAYLKISQPTTDDNKDSEELKTVQVQAILTITDNNLSIDNNPDVPEEGVSYALAQVEGWDLSSSPDSTVINNSKAKVVYTKTLEVETNKTMAVDLAFQIQDLVNHLLTKENTKVIPVKETTIPGDFLAVADGKLTGTITLDRRQPTSGNDMSTPEITETITPDPVADVNGTPLYKAEQLNIALDVHDGEAGADENEKAEKDKENSGLHEVTWSLAANDFITGTKEETWPGENVEPGYQRSITRNIGLGVEEGEQNNVTFRVTAEDNVGNHITHEKIFAVDTLAPRVTVTCTDEHNDVRNERYFKTERVATITVEELNFDESRTTITSDGGGTISDWTHDGTTHTATVSYTTDGTYSLSVEVTDLAGNTTGDGDVNYNGMTCPKDFVVDLTMPEIHVTYNPAKESGVYNGVLFYNELQHVTVTIDELNFDVQGLATEFPAGYQLSNFDSDDISHSAHVTFDNGNNYKFSIEFVDLAGNIAEAYTSPTFSVDCNAPVIDIVEANVSQEYLQPLGDELELVLQVTDDENNLAECNLVLTHVNNAFEQTVVSGDVYYTRSSADENESVTFTFKDFPYEKIYDGIYTVELKAKDHAGNNVELAPPIQFSMNRFGSTFVYGDEFTKDFLTAGDDGVVYHNNVDGNLVIQEINPTRVYTDDSKAQEGSSVTMVVNGQSTLLVQGQDYKLTVEEFGAEGSKWYVYTYEIYRDVFADGKDLVNGRYSIVLYGVDEAGNNNTNTLETVDGDQLYTAKVEFVLDTIAPVIITTGIESGEIYDAANKQMEIEIADSTPSTIQVSVNGQVVSMSSKDDVLSDDAIWLVQDEATGIYTLNVTEQNILFDTQEIQIKALDAADNAAEAEVTDFTITTNWFVRYVNSSWLLITLAGLAVLIMLIIVVSKKKKKVEV